MRLKDALVDTMLSNPRHISTTEEDHIYAHIVDGTVYEADFEECTEEHSVDIGQEPSAE